ncbi:MAG: tetratricopeptide repeat protein [Cyclobacteriaceae bacterium]
MFKNILLLVLALSSSTFGFAQALSTKNKKAIELYNDADNYRVRGQFDQAIRLLKLAIEKDKKFEEAFYRLGLVYKNADDRIASCEAFEQGLALTSLPLKQKAYYGILGENYLRSGKYEKAKFNLEKFLAIEKNDKVKIDHALLWKSQAEYGIAHTNENLGYRVKPLSDTVNKYPMQYFRLLLLMGKS